MGVNFIQNFAATIKFSFHDDEQYKFKLIRKIFSRLRRMIPYNKQQSQSNTGQSSGEAKLQLKSEPNPTNEQDNYENVNELEQQNDEDLEDEEVPARQDSECESKPQIFNINYVVPSSLIIREHQTEQRTADPSGSSYQQSSTVKGMHSVALLVLLSGKIKYLDFHSRDKSNNTV